RDLAQRARYGSHIAHCICHEVARTPRGVPPCPRPPLWFKPFVPMGGTRKTRGLTAQSTVSPRQTAEPLLRVRQLAYGRREVVRLGLVAGARRFAVQSRGQRRERVLTRLARERLGLAEISARRGDAIRREPIRPLELVEVRARHGERRRPH